MSDEIHQITEEKGVTTPNETEVSTEVLDILPSEVVESVPSVEVLDSTPLNS